MRKGARGEGYWSSDSGLTPPAPESRSICFPRVSAPQGRKPRPPYASLTDVP